MIAAPGSGVSSFFSVTVRLSCCQWIWGAELVGLEWGPNPEVWSGAFRIVSDPYMVQFLVYSKFFFFFPGLCSPIAGSLKMVLQDCIALLSSYFIVLFCSFWCIVLIVQLFLCFLCINQQHHNYQEWQSHMNNSLFNVST